MSRIYTVTLPDIGEGVVEGEVIEWLKPVGESVTQDEPVVIVMTDKATVELPAPYPGKMMKHYFKTGEISIKGKPLYDLELEEGVTATHKQQAKLKDSPSNKSVDIVENKLLKCARGNHECLALPSTRRLAQEMGINIEQVTATGKEGRVTPEDLRRHVQAGQSSISAVPFVSFSDDERVPIVGIKNLMMKRMMESKRQIPHFSYFEKVDATRLVKLREHFKNQGVKENRKVTYMPFLIRALCLAIKKFPQFNASVEGNELVIHYQQNIGVAMASPLGLIVPVLKNVQNMSLIDLVHAYEELKIRAATNKLHPQEMKEGTITISNFGVLGEGGLWATPVINYPEVAILAVNRIQKQPMVRNDEVVVREMLNLSWSFDHRVLDGDQAGDFSHYYTSLLENPAALL